MTGAIGRSKAYEGLNSTFFHDGEKDSIARDVHYYEGIFHDQRIKALLQIAHYPAEKDTGEFTNDFINLYRFLLEKNELYNIVPDHVIIKDIIKPEWVIWFLKQVFTREFQY